MKDWVYDASMALALVLPDERSAFAERFLSTIDERVRLWVPALWWYEVANGLAMAWRRDRISSKDLPRAIALIEQLPVQVDPLIGGDAARRFCEISGNHGVTAYDAAYLEVALRKGAALATIDRELARAGRAAGLTVAA